MPEPSPRDPDDHRRPPPGTRSRALSSHEERALERIERGLAGGDPAFERRMRSTHDYTTVPLPSRRTALLAVALVLVVSVVVGAPASWWGLLALLAVPVAAVWLLVGAVRRAHRRNSLPEV